MATATVSAQRSVRSVSRYLLWGLFGLMLAYVVAHNEAFLIDGSDPKWPHIHPFRWYLLPHGVAGACALLLAPMQFSDWLRCRYLQLHRVVGRIYVGGVLIAAPMGFYVQYFQERMGATRSFSLAAATQAVSWTVTTLVALILIRQGKVEQHRRWMTRSFAVALIFLEVRVILGATGWEKLGDNVTETVVWVCNVAALLGADLLLQMQETWRSRPVRARAQSGA